MGHGLVLRMALFIVAFATIQMVFLWTTLPNSHSELRGRHQPSPSTELQPPPITDDVANINIHHNEYRQNNTIHRPKVETPLSSNVSVDDLSHPPRHQWRQQQHAIPYVLIFTYSKNLLQEDPSNLDDEEQVLAANVRHSIDIHQSRHPIVYFWTDDDCIQSLSRVYPSLVPYFMNESQGMFKADICRGSALYEYGGIYLDVDVGVRHDLWQDLLPTTEFVTSRVHSKSHYPGHFFQAILGTPPQSPILYRYLRLFEKHYRGFNIVKGPLGVILLKRAWDDVYNNTTNDPPTELYQEILYRPQLFPNLHPPPTWGIRRACHFVVVAAAHQLQYVEFNVTIGNGKGKGGKNDHRHHNYPVHVPLYSRIGGSRMCPIIKPNDIVNDGSGNGRRIITNNRTTETATDTG